MDRNEVLSVLSLIKVAYPNSFTRQTQSDAQALVKLWELQFKDYSAELVINAINDIIATRLSEFVPPIAVIKQKCNELLNPNKTSIHEAWNLVKNALRNSLYNSQEEYAKLPESIQEAIGSHSRLKDWCLMDAQEIETFVFNTFSKSYNEVNENKRVQSLSMKERFMLDEKTKKATCKD